jgi:hypothetical protein
MFVGDCEKVVEEAVKELLSQFEGTSESCISWYLGVSIKFEVDQCSLSRASYITEVLTEYNMTDSHPCYTPMTTNFYGELLAHSNEEVVKGTLYRNMIGSLLFLANRTRPDVATAVGILSQYVSCPTAFLIKAVKRVLRYLIATPDIGLRYKRSSSGSDGLLQLVYVDADFARDKGDRKSRSGYVACLQGCSFSWTSRKQDSTSLFTAESEYVAMSECCKEVNWIRLFLSELQQDQTKPVGMCVDNQAAKRWSEMETSMRKAKHIEVRHHYVKECVLRKTIKPVYVPPKETFADGFTKPLDRNKFEQFRAMLGVHPC